MLFNGTNVGTFSYDQVTIPANARRSEYLSLLLPTLDLNQTYVRAIISDYKTKEVLHTTNFFYVRPIYLTLPKP